MESEKICRLCGECSHKPMYNIFNKNDNGQQLIQLIKQCLPILVYRTDPLPKEVCEPCYKKVNDFSSFQLNTVKTHDNFKSDLINRITEAHVRLYIDNLENSNQLEHPQVLSYQSLRHVRNNACQAAVETKTNCTNTYVENSLPNLKNITILTPNTINEKSKDVFVSLRSEDDGTIRKKRRLAGPRAGPKCKTRIQVTTVKKYSPLSLLQCVLKQINSNLNVSETLDNKVYDSDTTESQADTATLMPDSQESIYSESLDNGESSNSCFSSAELYSSSGMSVMEHSINILEPNVVINTYDTNVNFDEPVVCNYCMKKFDNIVKLSRHEIQHMMVDVGPRVDTKEFCLKHRRFASYQHKWMSRQLLEDGYKSSTPTPVKAAPIKRTPVRATPVKSIPVKSPVVHKVEYTRMETRKRVEKSKVYHDERVSELEEDENSLLVPNTSSTDHEFKVVNNEIVVKGVKLKDMEKQDRRALYKDIMINGIKRKFCPVCRHTFKDNWAMENHYFSDVCQYTCNRCGKKFKYQKEIFREHMALHKNEPNNKIFGPRDRKYRFKKKKKYILHNNRNPLSNTLVAEPVAPKVKPIKIKHLMQKKMNVQPPPVKIKTEPDLPPLNESVTLEASSSSSHEPYQAYFCRKCFKVFFKVDQYNTHIRICTGENVRKRNSNSMPNNKKIIEENLEIATPKRPQRSCVKDFSNLHDSDQESTDLPMHSSVKTKSPIKQQKSPETGFECGVCSSSFPSRHSRNSHMRIHKGHMASNKTVLNKVAPKSHAIAKPEPQQSIPPSFISNVPNADVRLANLNPTVARLVQNNPHLTIRSYTKAEVNEKKEQAQRKMENNRKISVPHNVSADLHQAETTPEHHIKRVYKCADCNEKFENKSVLYYHKINSCVVKRHYECAFCRKKFGTYDQYNTHMFYVHPE